MYYTTDDASREGFKPGGTISAGYSNPVREGLKQAQLEDMAYEYVNKWKVADLLFGVGSHRDADPVLSNPTGWRLFGSSVFGPVDSKVFLYVDNMNAIDFSYTNEYEGVEDAIKNKTGFLNKASQAMEFMRLARQGTSEKSDAGGKFVSRYTTLKGWKKSSGMKGMDSLSFTFRFGQAGLFDSLEEVVKPVLAIGSAFAPNFVSGNYMKGPLPTVAEYLVKVAALMGKAVMAQVTDAAKEKIEQLKAMQSPAIDTGTAAKPPVDETGIMNKAVNAFNNGVDALTKFQNELYQGIDSAITQVIGSSGCRVFYLRMGHIQAGPFTATGAKMSFDMSQCDERGYPVKGTVTISGMESFTMADGASVLHIFGGPDTPSSYPGYKAKSTANDPVIKGDEINDTI